jgi:hypothetical protein
MSGVFTALNVERGMELLRAKIYTDDADTEADSVE